MPNMDMDELFAGRRQFTEAQWIDVLLRSCGYEPTQFDERTKEDVKELVETIISDSWSFPALRP